MASIYGPVSATGWQLRLDYTVSQDAANNRSALALTLYIYDGTGESYNQAANSCRYVLQGKTVYQPYRYESKGWYKLGSSSVTVNHRSDGSGSAALSAAWYSGFTSQWTPASLSVAQTVALPVIPRASGLQAGAMTLGQTGTITVQRADATAAQALELVGKILLEPGQAAGEELVFIVCGRSHLDAFRGRWRGVRENRGDKGDMDAAPVLGGGNHRCGGRGLCVDGHHLFRQQRGGDQLPPDKAVCAGRGEAHRQSGGPGGE